MKRPLTIDPNRPLSPAEDYRALRDEGLAAVEQLAHEQWTDYNAHDPGRTVLEAFCYGLSEIGYRGNFPMANLLTGPDGQLRNDQGFFPARDSLTTAPVTNDDLRRLLIDDPKVRNAWVACLPDGCGAGFFPECKRDRLAYAPLWRIHPGEDASSEHEKRVVPRGLTDVWLQLESDGKLGNLNSNRIDLRLTYGSDLLPATLRFPDWRSLSPSGYRRIVTGYAADLLANVAIRRFRIRRNAPDQISNDGLNGSLGGLFYFDLYFELPLGGETARLTVADVSLRFDLVREQLGRGYTVPKLLEALLASGFVEHYLEKLQQQSLRTEAAAKLLDDNRKVGEDFCRFRPIRAMDVGVCADLHLGATADIEEVMAAFYRTIERHLDPPVPFHSLEEMVGLGLRSEEIFGGPSMRHGFLLQTDLDRANLRTHIPVSDLINDLMDLEGIVTIENLRFTTYDQLGVVKCGGREWSLSVPDGFYPVLYHGASGLTIFKDGLPFDGRVAETDDLLAELRADDRAVALSVSQLDYPLPLGEYLGTAGYLPVQRNLPEVYGLGLEGPPAGSDGERETAIQQLAGYLHPLEKIAAATTAQLNDFPELLSSTAGLSAFRPADPPITDPLRPTVAEAENLVAPLVTDGPDWADQLLQSDGDAIAQRNRFLDHMLARFGESVDNYVGLAHDLSTRDRFDQEALMNGKIDFLDSLVRTSGRRAMRDGLSERIGRLLGLGDAGPFLVEHILLRPKFPGDALLSVCLDEGCDHAGQEDPYSFQITYLFDGDTGLFAEDLRTRRYAERLIRRETPVHLLPKICWSSTEDRTALVQAYELWTEADAAFDWADLNEELTTVVRRHFGDRSPELTELFLGYYGEAFLAAVTGFAAGADAADSIPADFFDGIWTTLNGYLDEMDAPRVSFPADIDRAATVNDTLRATLERFYANWFTVSVLLRRVLDRLGDIESRYPVATLHDCLDGDDKNPTRLGHTTLGTFE